MIHIFRRGPGAGGRSRSRYASRPHGYYGFRFASIQPATFCSLRTCFPEDKCYEYRVFEARNLAPFSFIDYEVEVFNDHSADHIPGLYRDYLVLVPHTLEFAYASLIEKRDLRIVPGLSVFYYGTDNMGEAYYILSILNSGWVFRGFRDRASIFENEVKAIISSIPRYDPGNPDHVKLSELGVKGRDECVRELKSIREGIDRVYRGMIRRALYDATDHIRREIDEILVNMSIYR